jgi:hypothetical protein
MTGRHRPIRLVALLALPVALIVATPLSTAANPTSGGFVVGGGRYDTSECAINFSLSDAPGAIPGCPGQGHIKATVTCVVVSGNEAEVRGDIVQQSGSFSPDFFPPGDTVFVTDVQDNGNPSSGTPDTIVQYVDAAGTENNCSPPNGDEVFTVDQGNVTVHN